MDMRGDSMPVSSRYGTETKRWPVRPFDEHVKNSPKKEE